MVEGYKNLELEKFEERELPRRLHLTKCENRIKIRFRLNLCLLQQKALMSLHQSIITYTSDQKHLKYKFSIHQNEIIFSLSPIGFL